MIVSLARRAAVFYLFAMAVLAQAPQFEASDVRVAAPQALSLAEAQAAVQSTDVIDHLVNGLPEAGGQIRLHRVNMRILLEIAYREIFAASWAGRERSDYLEGLPGWSDVTFYDFIAKAAAHTSTGDLRLMVQAVLKDRFRLVVHSEQKIMPVFALVVGRNGPHLSAVEASGDAACQQECGGTVKTEFTGTTDLSQDCRGVSMEALALIVAHTLKEEVVDQTGLTGKYNFRFDTKMVCDFTDNRCSLADSVPAGLAKLGLAVERRNLPRPVIVIDHVDRVPSDN